MLERISDIKPFNYDELIAYCKQFPSVTFSDLGRRSYFAHLRYGKGQPVRDLDGRQLRILLESFGIKVHARIMHYSFDYNLHLNTDCYGIREQKVINGFTFLGQVKSDELVDLYSQYYATLFSTSSVDILNNITPRLYETMCSNAVVFFDTASDLEMESWEFRKVTSKEDAISKLQYVIEHPEFRKELIDEQHSYIRLVDEKLNSFR